MVQLRGVGWKLHPCLSQTFALGFVLPLKSGREFAQIVKCDQKWKPGDQCFRIGAAPGMQKRLTHPLRSMVQKRLGDTCDIKHMKDRRMKLGNRCTWTGGFSPELQDERIDTASSRDIFGCSKNRQNRIVENSTYPLDDFGFR